MNSRLLAGALLLSLAARAAGGTAAVLSSGGGAYMEALSAFQAAYGSDVPYYDLSRGKPALPPGTGVVAAFGGKAAVQAYPPGTRLVYAMAPGVSLKQPGAVKISLLPPLSIVLAKLKAIQPGLKALKVLWMTTLLGDNVERMKAEGAALGIAVTSAQVERAEDLPALLRRGLGTMDAFWLPPDPLLATAENLLILKEFSWANGIPFYGSTKGMTREGAVASAGVSFRDMGKTAAAAVRKIENGESQPPMLFPEKMELSLNATAARKCGLQLSSDLLKEADAVFP